MVEQETNNQDSGKDTSSTQPVSEVKITPPQSVSVKNSMPKDGIPPQIEQVLKDLGTGNGKEEK